MKIIIITIFATFLCAGVYAVEITKPPTHNTAWERVHGQSAKINDAECLSCHEERIDCIACHEDIAPRNHTISWVQKNHGLESRWNRMKCETCHRQDFCTECHETSEPLSHSRNGFGEQGSPSFHCNTGCQLPIGTWKNTVSKNCIVCHKTRPIVKSGSLHGMN